MICPSKICKAEISDDSLYCDQCGIQLLRCQKCNSVGLNKFCGKCGGVMFFKPIDTIQDNTFNDSEKQNSKNQFNTSSNQLETSQEQYKGTQIISSPINSFKLFYKDGWFLELKPDNILGREVGEFVSKLGVFPVISGKHAAVTFKDNKWYITDLHSTNKTYINNTCLVPELPTEIKNGDVLVLANIYFTAKIT